MGNIQLSEDKNITEQVMRDSIDFFELIASKYNLKPDSVLIEQQFMNKFNKGNTHNIRMMQHIYTYFLMRYPDIHIKMVPTAWKTNKNGCPKDEKNKKKWAVNKALELISAKTYNVKNYISISEDERKESDESDALLIIESVMKTPEETKKIWK